MSKTIIELDESDIRFGKEGVPGDPVHSFLVAVALLGALGGKSMSESNPNDPKDTMYGIRRHVASVLNLAARDGISITKVTE